ncbi:MAG TPA: hypothetical protein DD001_14615 [Microcoleaceae bacterium UBA10368]|nr:hypothetical protein [Microcoleaceae cyanobacterium UBA10368]
MPKLSKNWDYKIDCVTNLNDAIKQFLQALLGLGALCIALQIEFVNPGMTKFKLIGENHD